MIFWECGAFDFSGELLFYCSLTWQFSLYDSDGSYDHMEQLHFSICYPPEPKLKGLKECLWSYEFEDNLDLFGEAIRNHKIFQLLLNNTPIKYEMYWEMV
ncbi:hypothetical protein IMSAG049_01777 [Clostridiales bacterium]|nr:hypothetical protein IMSAG049_01777 [Clostridiales bacterium]